MCSWPPEGLHANVCAYSCTVHAAIPSLHTITHAQTRTHTRTHKSRSSIICISRILSACTPCSILVDGRATTRLQSSRRMYQCRFDVCVYVPVVAHRLSQVGMAAIPIPPKYEVLTRDMHTHRLHTRMPQLRADALVGSWDLCKLIASAAYIVRHLRWQTYQTRALSLSAQKLTRPGRRPQSSRHHCGMHFCCCFLFSTDKRVHARC